MGWGSSAGKGIVFWFVYWGVSDCFCGKAGAWITVQYADEKRSWIKTVMASAFPEKQLLLIWWQIKNNTLAGSSWFCGCCKLLIPMSWMLEMEVLSNLWHLQKQCKYLPLYTASC